MRAPGCLAVLLVGAAAVHAQETAPFRLTGIEGYVGARYLEDGLDTRQGGIGSRQRQRDLRTELFVMTHSYVYHPNFLTLDIGGGPILQQGRASAEPETTSSSSTLYNFVTRASFLNDKPYRGLAFYEHLNPTVSVAPGVVLTQENERYGAEASTLVPLPVYLDASRSRTRGSSAERVVDEDLSQFGLRASQALGRGGLTEFRYRASEQESMSGSPNLPVQRTSIDRQSYQLDTRVRLGARGQFDLFNLVSYDTQAFGLSQSPLPERTDRRFLLDLRAGHTERLKSFASLTHTSSDEGTLQARLNSGVAGLNYDPSEAWSLRASGRAEDNRTTQFSVRSQGAEGAVQHRRPLARGQLTAGYTARFDRREQEAALVQAGVPGERLTLTGTTPVALAQPRVVPGSVVVSNATRTQTFVEGLDYQLSVLGLTTRVQRLVGGNILDGQEVLVDYSFDTGGTFAVDQVDQALNVNWGLGGILDLYARYFESAPQLTSGVPTTPLNEVRSTLVGSRADVPLNLAFDLTLGGLYEHESRRETILPSQRRQAELYAQTGEPFFGTGHFRVTARRVDQAFETSAQDVRLRGYDLRLATRHPLGLEISANATYERDTGAIEERSRRLAAARAQWRYRQASLVMDYTRVRETQGAFERRRTLAQVLLRRDF